jgi:anti-sigma factor RsiW
MSCGEFTEFLHEYLFGNLPAEDRVEFEKHLAECSWCVAYLDSYRKAIPLEQAAFAAPEDAPPPPQCARGVGPGHSACPVPLLVTFRQQTTHTALFPFFPSTGARVAACPMVGASAVTFPPSGHPKV